jgi:predicted branched-subunit amino acid permease
MSVFLFAGSSQIVIVQLLGSSTPLVVIVLTTFIINLRHALYSASIAPYVQHLQPVWKGALAFLLTDEGYALSITHYDRNGSEGAQHWYFLGVGLSIWGCFQACTALGIFLGAQIPEAWALDFTLALTFIALVIPVLKDRPIILSAVAAGLTAVAAHAMPYKLGLILAAFVGIGVGLWSETKWQTSG